MFRNVGDTLQYLDVTYLSINIKLFTIIYALYARHLNLRTPLV